jgi:hypothetical protein
MARFHAGFAILPPIPAEGCGFSCMNCRNGHNGAPHCCSTWFAKRARRLGLRPPACTFSAKPPIECKKFGHIGDCIDTWVFTFTSAANTFSLGDELDNRRSTFATAADCGERNERSSQTLVDTRSRSTTKE